MRRGGGGPVRRVAWTAREHAAESGLSVDYRVGTGEHLPVEDDAFDIVYCCDVLEHVDDVDAVIAETARVLRYDGVYLFDTVNRTMASKLLAIKVFQEWRWTRLFDTAVHEWGLFITPDELLATLSRHARRGRLSYGELSRLLDFGVTRGRQMSYMGFATLN